MPTTPNMGMVLPTEDASDDEWDSLLNAALTLNDAHDHSDGNGVKIGVSGLDIQDELDLNNNALTGINVATFEAISPIVSGSLLSLFVGSDNELYWRTNGGVNVQVTDGSSLNSSLLGGIVGDYGQGDEEVSYSAGSSIYNFLTDDSPETRAYIDCSDIRLFEASAGVSNAVKLKSRASLAASYTLTFPAALPAGQRILQVESDGDIVASNTVTAAATFSALITASAGLTAAANQDITVSGTGKYNRGSLVRSHHVKGGNGSSGTFGTHGWAPTANTDTFAIPIPLEEGERLTQVTARIKDTAAGGLVELIVYRHDFSSTATLTQLGSTATSAGDASEQTLTVGSLTEVAGTSQYAYIAHFSFNGAVTTTSIRAAWSTTDLP